MSRSHAARMPANFDNYKHLTVGDVLPDATTKLYKRLITRTRKKYIPVKDISKDDSGRELSAYLIHPDFIDKSVIASQEITEHLEPRPNIQVIQYSKITSLRPTPAAITEALPKYMFNSMAYTLSGWIEQATQLVQTAYERAKTVKIPLPAIEVYSISKGLKARRPANKATVAKAGIIALILTGSIFAYSNLGEEGRPSAAGGVDYISQPTGNGSSSSSDASKPVPGSVIPNPKSEGSFTPTPLSTTSTRRVVTQTNWSSTAPTSTVNVLPNQTQSPINTEPVAPAPIAPVVPEVAPTPTPPPTVPPVVTHPTTPPQAGGLGGTVDEVVDGATNTVSDTVDTVLGGL